MHIMNLNIIKHFSLLLALLFAVSSVYAGASITCIMACDCCESVQIASSCTDDKMAHHSMVQFHDNQSDTACPDGEHCWHDCDFDPVGVVAVGEREYSPVPPHNFLSVTRKPNHFSTQPVLPPPVALDTPLYTLHCTFLI